MKSLNIYIKEQYKFLVNRINNKQEYKYKPNDKERLIQNIVTELRNGNTNLNIIDTSNITDMSYLFSLVTKEFNAQCPETINCSKWNVSNVTDMSYMFFDFRKFNSDLSKWDVHKVEDMSWMFAGCIKFDQYLNIWNVANVKDMKYMFWNCKEYNQDMSAWDIRNVTNFCNMFQNCQKLDVDLEQWSGKINSNAKMDNMFFKSNTKIPSWYLK